jgi:hypothetical protein
VAAELHRIERADVLVLAKLADVAGPAPAPPEVAVRVPEWLPARLAIGDHYVVAYSAVATDPTQARALMVDPQGPRILTSSGLEPALFADTPQAREWLGDYPRAAVATSAAYRRRVLDGLEATDAQWRRYFAAELALRPQLAETLRGRDRDRVRAFVASADAPPSARALLLGAALEQPEAYDAPRLDAVVREILATLPVEGIGAPDDGRAVLAHTAFTWCTERKLAFAPERLARWLVSDQAPLVEAALLAIRRSAPHRERALAEAALEQSLLPVTTRTFLREHLRRLAIMQRAIEAEDRVSERR